MEEHYVDSIRVRSDVIGDFENSDKLLGFKAEMFLKKVLKENAEFVTNYLSEKYDLCKEVYLLQDCYKEKYKKYLKDPEAKAHIIEKYGDKQTLIEVVCFHITDLPAKECIRLKEYYEEKGNLQKLIHGVCSNYIADLTLILGNDSKKKENM